jgi:putative cyclase
MNPISDRCTGVLVRRPAVLAGLMLVLGLGCASAAGAADDTDLWAVYDQHLKGAKYIDLTHTITPNVPVWSGFGPSKFEPAIDPKTGQAYSYAKDGFEAMHYNLMTDQLGTQLDPPAHWAPEYPPRSMSCRQPSPCGHSS